MFVDYDRVKADLVGKDELRKIALIKRVALLGVIIFVREIYPKRLVVLLIFRQVHIGHEVHEVKTDSTAHRNLPW